VAELGREELVAAIASESASQGEAEGAMHRGGMLNLGDVSGVNRAGLDAMATTPAQDADGWAISGLGMEEPRARTQTRQWASAKSKLSVQRELGCAGAFAVAGGVECQAMVATLEASRTPSR